MIIAVGMLHQETNTFNRRVTHIEDLDVCEGQDAIERWRGRGMPLAGSIDVLESAGMKLHGLLAVTGASGGRLVDDDCERLLGKIVDNAVAAQADALYLDLHGALVSESEPDVTGELLRRLHLAADVPIAVSFDCHANLTGDIVSNVDLMVGFKTWPHVDQFDTGARAAALLLALLRGEIKPSLRVVTVPMIQAPEKADFTEGPMASLVTDMADRQQRRQILDGTLFPTQPWLDVPALGTSVSIITDDNAHAAEQIARQVAQEWWGKRKQFVPQLLKPADAVKQALNESVATVMISESADSINSGSSGDNPALIRALVEHGGLAKALTFTCDPAMLDQLADCELGAHVPATFGRDCDRRFAEPFHTELVVENRVDGRFCLEGKFFSGLEQDMGGAAVLRIRNIHVLVARNPVFCSEPSMYRCARLEPSDYRIVGIKSPGSFRPNFSPVSTTVIHLDMPGASSPHLASMPWENIQRPLFPLDDDMGFMPVCMAGKRG